VSLAGLDTRPSLWLRNGTVEAVLSSRYVLELERACSIAR